MDQEHSMDIEWHSNVWLSKGVTNNLINKLGGFISFKKMNKKCNENQIEKLLMNIPMIHMHLKINN